MKVRLLNDGGFGDMESVQFPVVVEARDIGSYLVSSSELYRVGARDGEFDELIEWAFLKGLHAVEVIHES